MICVDVYTAGRNRKWVGPALLSTHQAAIGSHGANLLSESYNLSSWQRGSGENKSQVTPNIQNTPSWPCMFARICRCTPLLAWSGMSGVSGFVSGIKLPNGSFNTARHILDCESGWGRDWEKKGEHSRAAGKGKEGITTSAEPGTWVSGANICTHLDLSFTL